MVLGNSCENVNWAPPPPQGLRPTAWEPQCQSPKEVDIFLSVLGTTWGPWQRLETAQVFFPLRYGACAVRSLKSEFSRQSDLSLCSHCPVFVTADILTYPHHLLNEHGRRLNEHGEWNQRGKASAVVPGLWDTRDLVRTQLGTCCDDTPPALANLTGKHGPVCF